VLAVIVLCNDDEVGKRKADETREYHSKGSYMFFRIVHAMRSRENVGVV
jgi:hypothetical protein